MENIDHHRLGKSRIESSRIDKPRSEVIRAARESCSKNLNPTRKHNKYSSKTKFTYNKSLNNPLNFEKTDNNVSPFKAFLTKIILALAIFITVPTMRSLDTKNNTDYSQTIETLITSNTTIERAEDFFISLLDKVGK